MFGGKSINYVASCGILPQGCLLRVCDWWVVLSWLVSVSLVVHGMCCGTRRSGLKLTQTLISHFGHQPP